MVNSSCSPRLATPSEVRRGQSLRVAMTPEGREWVMSDEEVHPCSVPAFLATYRPAVLHLGDAGLDLHGAVQATTELAAAVARGARRRIDELLSPTCPGAVAGRLHPRSPARAPELGKVVRVVERSAALADVDLLVRAGGRLRAVRLLWGFEDADGRAVVPCLEHGRWRLRAWTETGGRESPARTAMTGAER